MKIRGAQINQSVNGRDGWSPSGVRYRVAEDDDRKLLQRSHLTFNSWALLRERKLYNIIVHQTSKGSLETPSVGN